MKYKGKYFTVVEEQGIFRKGMVGYCFDEQADFVRMWFQKALFSDIHEVKIPTNQMFLFREKYKTLLDK
jgi:hypothetical protein